MPVLKQIGFRCLSQYNSKGGSVFVAGTVDVKHRIGYVRRRLALIAEGAVEDLTGSAGPNPGVSTQYF